MAGSVDISKFLASLKQEVQPRARKAAKKAVRIFAEHVIGEAKELVPYLTGDLSGSATVQEVVDDGTDIYTYVGFNMYYAAAVHERLNVKHPQGQAKYLETALRANAPKFAGFIIDEVNKELG